MKNNTFKKYSFLAAFVMIFHTGLPANAQVLTSLISEAVETNPQVRSQQSNKKSLEYGVDSARWQFFPTPAVSVQKVSAQSQDLAYQGGGTRVSILSMQQPLWAGGRLSAGLDRAEAALKAGEASYEDARLQVALRVVQSYGEWMAANLKSRANLKSLSVHERLLIQVQRRIEQGVAPESDAILAISRLESVKSDLVITVSQQEIARNKLSQLVGRRVVDRQLEALLETPLKVKGDASDLLNLGLSYSPNVRKSQAQANLQLAQIAERKADLSPEVFLRAERQFGSFNYQQQDALNRVFVGVTSRLGAGMSSLASVSSAQSQYDASLEDVASQERQVTEQILADVELVGASRKRLVSLSASLNAAQATSESFDRQFLSGRKNWLDVMNAAREIAQIETQLADAIANEVSVSWRLAANVYGVDHVLGISS